MAKQIHISVHSPVPQEGDHVTQRRDLLLKGRQTRARLAISCRGAEGPGGLLVHESSSAVGFLQEDPHVDRCDRRHGGRDLDTRGRLNKTDDRVREGRRGRDLKGVGGGEEASSNGAGDETRGGYPGEHAEGRRPPPLADFIRLRGAQQNKS